jgi:hypothetical protein
LRFGGPDHLYGSKGNIPNGLQLAQHDADRSYTADQFAAAIAGRV